VRSPCQVVIGPHRAGRRRTTDRRRSVRRRSTRRRSARRLSSEGLGCWGLGGRGLGGRGLGGGERGGDHVPGLPTEKDGRRARAQPNGQQDERGKSGPIERDAREVDGTPRWDRQWKEFHLRKRLNAVLVMAAVMAAVMVDLAAAVAATNHANGSRVASSSSIPPEARQSGEIVSRTGSRDGRSGRFGNSRNADKSTQRRRIRM
jgi:hypothetical protein